MGRARGRGGGQKEKDEGASKRARKQASKQASKQTSKPASKKAGKARRQLGKASRWEKTGHERRCCVPCRPRACPFHQTGKRHKSQAEKKESLYFSLSYPSLSERCAKRREGGGGKIKEELDSARAG